MHTPPTPDDDDAGLFDWVQDILYWAAIAGATVLTLGTVVGVVGYLVYR